MDHLVIFRRKTYSKKSVQKMVTARREPAQEETQSYPKHPPSWAGSLLAVTIVTTFSACVLGRPKTIILQFWEFLGFGQSRGHGRYNVQDSNMVSPNKITSGDGAAPPNPPRGAGQGPAWAPEDEARLGGPAAGRFVHIQTST